MSRAHLGTAAENRKLPSVAQIGNRSPICATRAYDAFESATIEHLHPLPNCGFCSRRKMNPRRWLHEHSLKLLAIRDTPEAIAGGVAIGLFFGFSPLFGLRFLAPMFFAWLPRSNILAAGLATTLHDVVLPLIPVTYPWQSDVGF